MSKKLLIPLGVFLVLCAFLLVGLWRDPREVPSPLIVKQAPGIVLAQLHEHGLVIDEQDALALPLAPRVELTVALFALRGRRKIEVEGAALALLTRHLDAAAQRRHDAVDD